MKEIPQELEAGRDSDTNNMRGANGLKDESRPTVDFSFIMHLEDMEFLRQAVKALYFRDLRACDQKMFLLLKRGVAREAVLYLLCTSKPFHDAFAVEEFERYEEAYAKYARREKIRNMPIIGAILSFFTMPAYLKRIEESLLSREFCPEQERRREEQREELRKELNNFHCVMMEKLDAIHAVQMHRMTEIHVAEMHRMENDFIALQDGAAREDAARMKQFSELNASFDKRAVLSACPTGVTVVNAGDVIMGIPMREWTAAARLSWYGKAWGGAGQWLRSYVERGMVVIDIGAGFGAQSVWLAWRIGPEGNLFAFEQEQDDFELLCANMEINALPGRGNIRVCQELHPGVDVAVSDHRVDVVRVDARNAVFPLSANMLRMAERNPNIKAVVEVEPELLTRNGIDPEQWYNELAATFQVSRIDENGSPGSPGPVVFEEIPRGSTVDLLLCKTVNR